MLSFSLLIVAFCAYLFILSALSLGKKEKQFFIILGAIFFMLLVSLRPNIFPDTQSYRDIFNKVDISKHYGFNPIKKEIETSVEYGFVWLIWIIKKFAGISADGFLIIIAFMELLCYVGFVNKFSKKDIDSITNTSVMLFPYFGMLWFFVTIRVGLAMLIALNAFFYASTNKAKSALYKVFWYAIAFSFHRIVIIVAGLELLYRFIKIRSKKYYFVVFCISVLLIALGKYITMLTGKVLNIVSNKFDFLSYSDYLRNTDFANYKAPLRVIYFVLMSGVPILYYDRIKENSEKTVGIASISSIVTALTSGINGASRIYDCFNVFIVIILSKLTLGNEKNRVLDVCVRMYCILGLGIIYRLLIL